MQDEIFYSMIWKMKDERRKMKEERWKKKDERRKMKDERWFYGTWSERWKMNENIAHGNGNSYDWYFSSILFSW